MVSSDTIVVLLLSNPDSVSEFLNSRTVVHIFEAAAMIFWGFCLEVSQQCLKLVEMYNRESFFLHSHNDICFTHLQFCSLQFVIFKIIVYQGVLFLKWCFFNGKIYSIFINLSFDLIVWCLFMHSSSTVSLCDF